MKETMTVGRITITPIVRGGFWLMRDGTGKEVLPGVMERLIKDFYESLRGIVLEEENDTTEGV